MTANDKAPPNAGPLENPFPPLTPDERRVLAILRQPGGSGWPDAIDRVVRLRRRVRGVSLGAGEASFDVADSLVERGLAFWTEPSGASLLAVEDRLVRARRPLALVDGEEGPRTVLVNPAESPLAWLHRRRGRDGHPLIDDAAFAAGERLRADLTRAGTLPSMTSDWTRPYCDASLAPGERLNPSDAAIAARQRVQAALKAAGPEFAGLLVDLCGFLKPLGQIESERGWPVRSGKVMAVAALGGLARHYGIASVARGPRRMDDVLHWGAPGYRPTIT